MRAPLRTAAPVHPSFYGGVQPSGTIGLDQFRSHDSSKTWDDEGLHAKLLEEGITAAMALVKQQLAPEMKRYGADQVRDGVADYVANCYVEAGIHGEQLVIAVDASNDQASFRVYVSLGDVLSAAVADAQAKGDQRVAERLSDVAFAVEDALAGKAQAQTAPIAVPVRPRGGVVRQGREIGART